MLKRGEERKAKVEAQTELERLGRDYAELSLSYKLLGMS